VGILSLITPFYDPNRPNPAGKKRGLVNVEYSLGIWLDQDIGAFTIEDFATLFPTLQFVVCNTYHTTRICKKYRVVIPTDGVMTAAAYGRITKHLIAKIGPEHGFDTSKLNSASMLLMPCQAQDKTSSFFVVYDGPGREPLNVVDWLREVREVRATTRDSLPPPPPINDDAKQRRIDKVVGKWRAADHSDGHDRPQFYNLCLALMGHCRCDENETRRILRDEAPYSHNPDNRLRQIEGAISKAKKKIYGVAS
jgi:hypothetical protein